MTGETAIRETPRVSSGCFFGTQFFGRGGLPVPSLYVITYPSLMAFLG